MCWNTSLPSYLLVLLNKKPNVLRSQPSILVYRRRFAFRLRIHPSCKCDASILLTGWSSTLIDFVYSSYTVPILSYARDFQLGRTFPYLSYAYFYTPSWILVGVPNGSYVKLRTRLGWLDISGILRGFLRRLVLNWFWILFGARPISLLTLDTDSFGFPLEFESEFSWRGIYPCTELNFTLGTRCTKNLLDFI